MRIVAGRHKGRQLAAPVGLNTRPTSDRARQALFNILSHGPPDLREARVLDVFAGSGALGLEALSRGAAHASFIENDRTALRALADNIAKLGVAAQAAVLAVDAVRPPAAAAACDFIFMDPPYGSGRAQTALIVLAEKGWLQAEGLIVVEVAAAEPFESPLADWSIADERRYGAARLVFLRRGSAGVSPAQ